MIYLEQPNNLISVHGEGQTKIIGITQGHSLSVNRKTIQRQNLEEQRHDMDLKIREI